MLYTIRENAFDVYTLNIETAGDRQPMLDEILHAFRLFYTPKKNIVSKHHQFLYNEVAWSIVVTSKGVKPVETKVLAIKNMQQPEERVTEATCNAETFPPNSNSCWKRMLLGGRSHKHSGALDKLKSTLT